MVIIDGCMSSVPSLHPSVKQSVRHLDGAVHVSLCVCQLEDVELTVADHMQKVLKPNFAAAWEEIGDSNELEDTYGLSSMKSVEGEPHTLRH